MHFLPWLPHLWGRVSLAVLRRHFQGNAWRTHPDEFAIHFLRKLLPSEYSIQTMAQEAKRRKGVQVPQGNDGVPDYTWGEG